MSVLVFVEGLNGEIKKSSLEAASYGSQVAKQLGTSATAVAIGDVHEDALTKLGEQGISKVLYDADDRLTQFVADAYVKVIANAAQQESAKVLVFSNTNVGAAVGSELAVRLNGSLVTNVTALPTLNGNSFVVTRGVFSGKAFADVELTADVKVIAVKKNSIEVAHEVGTAIVEKLSADLTDADFAAAPKETVMQETDGVLLPEAEIVVSGGRGLKGPENWHLVEDLAKALGAATACSKPVSDMDWRPHHEHVGQTGITVSPNLYIAIGISGAIQHLAGVNSSKVIVVINKDPEAPFFKAADYGIVGDAFEVVPKLIEAAKSFRQIDVEDTVKKIQLEILGLSSSQSQTGSFALVLGERDGNRRLPIIIGMFEAQSIAIQIEKINPNRPLTHDLFKSFAEQMDVKVTEILISDLKEGVFYSKIMCTNGTSEFELDSRPSDAIAIGLRFGVPIYTVESVLSEAGIILSDLEEEDEENEELTVKSSSTAASASSGSKEPLNQISVDELNKLLNEALEKEDYERAAKIRDELNKRN